MLSYREIAPAPEIAHLALSFWEFAATDEMLAPVEHEVFPDGCISLLYYRNDNLPVRIILISGLSLESVKTPVYGNSFYWGMRLSPAACAKILRCDPAQIYHHPLEENKDFPNLTNQLLQKLDRCRDFAGAVSVFENILEDQNLAIIDIDEKVAAAVQIIEENKGEIKIADLAGQVNLSPRQLERRFKQNSGLTPKQYARARRIRATAVSLVEESSMNWAHRAAEMGFTDQAHLSHEVASVTGRSPNSFAGKIKQIEHGHLVK